MVGPASAEQAASLQLFAQRTQAVKAGSLASPLRARLLGLAATLSGAEDPDLYIRYRAEYGHIVAAMRAQLDGAAFEAAQATGRKMAADDLAQAIAWAMGASGIANP